VVKRHTPWLVATVAAVAVVALLVAVARSGPGSSPAAAPRETFSSAVRTDIQPRTHGFGETLTALLEVTLPTDAYQPGSLRARGSFDPYEVVGEPALVTERVGDLTVARYTIRIRCVAQECLPEGETKQFVFGTPDDRGEARPGVSLTWRVPSPEGRRFADRRLDERRAFTQWPAVTVARGVTDEDLDETGWRSALAALPEPTRSASPTRLERALLAGATLLVFVATLLVAAWWRDRERAQRAVAVVAVAQPSTLEQALRLAETVDGDGAERRVALETLATELRAVGEEGLAGETERLAWDVDPPRGEAVAALAASVRSRANGGPP
jgi:hypothetical protein